MCTYVRAFRIWVGCRSPAKRICRVWDFVRQDRQDNKTSTAMLSAKDGRKDPDGPPRHGMELSPRLPV